MLFALSDIHGERELFEERIGQIDRAFGLFSDGSRDRLVLLGDYIDRGPDSCGALRFAKELQDRLGERCVVLRGNHEQWFSDFLFKEDNRWLEVDSDLVTSRTFLGADQLAAVREVALKRGLHAVYAYMRDQMLSDHRELLEWMRDLPLFHETGGQVFVHAAIDEEMGALWREGTDPDMMLNVFPERVPVPPREFYLDVVAGHVATSSVSGDPQLHDVFWDGASHFYIDGTTNKSKRIPVLAYDERDGTYYSLDDEGRLVKIC